MSTKSTSELLAELPKGQIWPDDFYGPLLSSDHCRDVLAGSYDVPFMPKDAPVILDIGANVGAFARWAALRWPGSKIHCYEPAPENFKKLRRTVADIGTAEVLTHNEAVADAQGVAKLTIGGLNCGEFSICYNESIKGETVDVDVIAAKDLPKADILKIDAEGAEHAILHGLKEAGRLGEFSAIMLEYHSAFIRDDLTKLLQEAGLQEIGHKVFGEHRGEIKYMSKDKIEDFGLGKIDLKAKQPEAKRKPAPQSHFVAIIAHDGMITANTVDALLQIQHTTKAWAGWKFDMAGGQVLSRNKCVNTFIDDTPCSHFLFLDGDVIPRVEHVMALRKHPEAADSIICGVYCKKEDRVAHVYNSLKGGNPAPNAHGLMEVAKGATGFMQIPRTALDKIRAAFPERYYLCDYDKDEKGNRKKKYSYFFHDIRMDAELGFMRDQSEDWAFCELARAAGVRIYIDVTTTTWLTPEAPPVLHRGATTFPLRTELERLEAVETIERERAQHAEEVSDLRRQVAQLMKNVRV